MARFVAYTGDASDPMQQQMRFVDAESYDEVFATVPGCIAVQIFVPPTPELQPAPDAEGLARGTSVWSY